MESSLRMRRTCHVTYHRGPKMIHIFEIPDPNLPIHFVSFRALRRRLSHVIGKKLRFPLWRLQSSLSMRSITTWTQMVPPKHNNFLIFWYWLCTFYGAMMTI